MQLEAYKAAVYALLPATDPLRDPANRIGELKARTRTLDLLYYQRFWPSIPPTGFTTSP